jgi:hypothetical protein
MRVVSGSALVVLAVAGCADDPPIRAAALPACGDPTAGRWDEAFVAPGVAQHSIVDHDAVEGAHVDAIARLPDGSLVAGGAFATAAGAAITNVARWDGSAWHAMGDGLPPVRGLAVHDGAVWAIGDGGLARWDGASWETITTRRLDAIAVSRGLIVTGDVGELVSGGHGVAVWNGLTWTDRDLTDEPQRFDTIAATDDGFCLGGAVRAIDGFAHDGVACWSDATSSWSALGPPTAIPTALARGPDGRWWIGRYTADVPGAELAVLTADGDAWQAVPGVLQDPTHPFFLGGYLTDLAFLGGDVVVAGMFQRIVDDRGEVQASAIAAWTGTGWRPYPGADVLGFAAYVSALVPDGDRLHVGGQFTAVGGIAASNVATLGPDRATPWASGALLGATGVEILAPHGDGIVAIGAVSAGDVAGAFAARFEAGAWSTMAQPAPDGSLAQAVARTDGTLVASTTSGVYEWRGGAWTPLAEPALAESPLAIDADDRVYLRIDADGPEEVVRLDGDHLDSLGTVPSAVVRLEVLDDALLAFTATELETAIYVRRDGAWTELEGVPIRYDRAVVVPALGLVVTAPDGVHVWDADGWRLLSSEVHLGPVTACDGGVVTASREPPQGAATLWFFDGAGWHELGRDSRPMWGAALAVGTDGIFFQPNNGGVAAAATALWRY